MIGNTSRIIHLINYAWPYVDGYTVRSISLVKAQLRYLDFEIFVVVSPFPSLTNTYDPEFTCNELDVNSQIYVKENLPILFKILSKFEKPHLGFSPFTSSFFYSELDKLIERIQPDMIHVHHPHYVGSLGINIAQKWNIPCVYEIRCFNGDYGLSERIPWYYMGGLLHNMHEYRVCRKAAVVVTISKFLAHRIIDNGVPRERVFIVRNSVDTDLFKRKKCLAHKDNCVVLGYATTFHRIEGIDLLLESISLLKERRVKLKVLLAGTGPDWPRIRRLVERYELAEQVDLLGFVSYHKMPSFYNRLDLFVVPRPNLAVTMDTTPLKPLEALAVGIPILASDLPALRELLECRNGVQFVKPNPRAFADAIEKFCNSSCQLITDDISERCWAQEVQKYVQIYQTAHNSH